MNSSRALSVPIFALPLALDGCATRPVNPPPAQVELGKGYTLQTRQKHFKSQDNLVLLAFSGGGTRAVAFSSSSGAPRSSRPAARRFAWLTPSI